MEIGMETEKFVEKLDKLNKLKAEGTIDEDEYETQINTLEKQYAKENNKSYRQKIINYSDPNSSSENYGLLSLLLFFTVVIGGICFFLSDAFKDITTASKEFINKIKNPSFSENTNLDDYNNEIDVNSTSQLATNPSTVTQDSIKSSPQSSSPSLNTNQQQNNNIQSSKPIEQPKTNSVLPKVEEPASTSNSTLGEKNALSKAKSYLNVSAFSKSRINKAT